MTGTGAVMGSEPGGGGASSITPSAPSPFVEPPLGASMGAASSGASLKT